MLKRVENFKLPPELLQCVPVFVNDPRQEQLMATVENNEKLIANVQLGYMAGAPDLSFIQWLSLAAIRMGMDRREAIRAAIVNGVQCVESTTIRPTSKDDILQVSFTTFDDFGKYAYKFQVDCSVVSYPPPLIVERLRGMAT